MTRHHPHQRHDDLDELEADAARARREVVRAIGSLRRGLPEFEDVELVVGAAARDAGAAVRRNPVPAALLGACAAWLTYDVMRGDGRNDDSRRNRPNRKAARRETLRAEIEELEDRLARLRGATKDRAHDVRNAASEAVDEAGDALRDGTARAAEAVEKGARNAGRHARAAGRQARDEAEDAISSHPFASTAMAFVLGAVVSAAARGRSG